MRRSTMSRLDSRVLCVAISLSLAGPVAAGCDNSTPGTGAVVTCTANAPNPDRAGVQGLPGASGVRVNVQAGASILNPLTPPGFTRDAIVAQGSDWSIDNAGSVQASGGTGTNNAIVLQGGTITNRAGAVVAGGFRATGVLNTGGALQLINAGSISGGRGVLVQNAASSTITNQEGGVIFGDRGGAVVFLGSESHVLNNFGTLAGRVLFDAGNDTLLLGTGSTLGADAFGGGGRNTLALQGTGTEDALFNGFEQIDVGTGANWALTGAYDTQGALRTDVGTGARLQLGGVLTGTSLEKVGAGILALTGDASAVAGANELRAGVLHLDGRLGGSLRVASGARLTGAGTAGSVTNEGLIDPGNGIGTLTISGNYIHASGATLRVDIAPGSSDRLAVTGQATLNGGTVQVVKVNGQSIGTTRYVIVDAAGGVLGRFAQLTQDMPFLHLVLAYDANRVYLDVGRSETRFGQVCDIADTCAVARAVDAASTTVLPGNALVPVLDALTLLNVAGANAALSTLSGGSHATLTDMVMQASASMRMPLDAAGTPPQRGIRLRGHDESGHLSDGTRASQDTRGLALDFDTGIGEYAWLGGSLSTQRTNARIGLDRADIDMLGIEGRIGWAGQRIQTSLAAGSTQMGVALDRRIEVGTERRVASSERDARLDWVRGEVATRLDAGTWAMQPFIDLVHQRLDSGTVSEDVAGVGLMGSVSEHRRTSSAVGARASGEWRVHEWTLEPMVQLAWRHVLSDRGGDFFGALAGAPTQTFTSQGIRADSDGWHAQLAVTARRGSGFAGTLGYGLQRAADARVHGVYAALRWNW